MAAVAASLNTSDDELVIALTSLVQNLTYDCEKLFSYEYRDAQDLKPISPMKHYICRREFAVTARFAGENSKGIRIWNRISSL